MLHIVHVLLSVYHLVIKSAVDDGYVHSVIEKIMEK